MIVCYGFAYSRVQTTTTAGFFRTGRTLALRSSTPVTSGGCRRSRPKTAHAGRRVADSPSRRSRRRVDEIVEQRNLPVFGPASESILMWIDLCPMVTRCQFQRSASSSRSSMCQGTTAATWHISVRGSLLCGDTLFAGGVWTNFRGHVLSKCTTPCNDWQPLISILPCTVPMSTPWPTSDSRSRSSRTTSDFNNGSQSLSDSARMVNQPYRPPSVMSSRPTHSCAATCRKYGQRRGVFGRPLLTEVEVFAAVRTWKDGWRG